MYYDCLMKYSAETLRKEMEQERWALVLDSLLTLATLVGLIGGIIMEIWEFPVWYAWSFFGVAFITGGFRALIGALASLFKGKLDIDLLMVLAALAAAGVGEVRDGAILLFLFSLAGTLEAYAMGNTKRAVAGLMKLRPDEAYLEQSDGSLVRVAVEKLRIGDSVVVKPGERIPVDGTITRGSSVIDQSSVTGESVPVDALVGSSVYAGSVNGYGVLALRVDVVSDQSTLARMIELVASAQAERSPSERFSEWFGSRYTFVVLFGSIASLGIFLLLGIPLTLALYKAATLLVVASPCAIVISVPAAVLSALAYAARHGMLFKGGAALEEFGTIKTIAFDKTGTLTTGAMAVTKVLSFGMPETDLLKIAVTLEAHSEHPLAKSILLYAAHQGITPHETAASTATAIPGKGMEAVIDGVPYWAGNRRFLSDKGLTLGHDERTQLEQLEAMGITAIILGDATRIIGFIGIADTVRDSALEAIALLRSSGIKRIVMLTGDHASVANAVGATLGILPSDIHAGLLPEDKVVILKKLEEEGPVAFVGDGVNDAAALAVSNVGIAMGVAGTDVALEAADVALLSDDLRKLVAALRLSKRTNQIIKQNLVFALGILFIMVMITTFWYLPLPLGVIGHEGGTLLVVANGLRLLWGYR